VNWKAALVLLVCTLIQGPTVASNSDAVTHREWKFLCTELRSLGYDRVNCRRIEKPTVVITTAVKDIAAPGWELYGVTYDGEPYVLINPDLDQETTRMVIVHETVHYVLWQFYGNGIGDCESERVARKVHHAWDKTDYALDKWESDYGCKGR